MLPASILAAVEAATGAPPAGIRALSGGCVGEVYGLAAAGVRYALKVDRGRSGVLQTEGRMLDYLARHTALPAPRRIAAGADFLLMSWVEGSPGGAEEDAARHLAALHDIGAGAYGFDFDTVIAGLPQPNAWAPRWLEFFAERRLMEMARQAFDAGQLPRTLLAQTERLAARLPRLIDEPARPGLVHGDVWSGNVLTRGGAVAGFVDPALYFADPEVELAFITLFATFGAAFFRRYAERRPLSPDFHAVKRDLYTLYPLLVHARLFGGGYVAQAASLLRRFAG